MRKHIFQILGETQRVGSRGKQRQHRVEHILGDDSRAVILREADDQGGYDVERPVAGAVVAQWEGVTAVTAAKGVIVREQAVTPDSWAGSSGEGHGVKGDVLRAPDGLEFRAASINKRPMIIQVAIIERPICDA